jgi:hypothetical protein
MNNYNKTKSFLKKNVFAKIFDFILNNDSPKIKNKFIRISLRILFFLNNLLVLGFALL